MQNFVTLPLSPSPSLRLSLSPSSASHPLLLSPSSACPYGDSAMESLDLILSKRVASDTPSGNSEMSTGVGWYVIGQDQQLIGPYTIWELQDHYRSGYLQESTLVWTEGCSDWQPLSSVYGVLTDPSSVLITSNEEDEFENWQREAREAEAEANANINVPQEGTAPNEENYGMDDMGSVATSEADVVEPSPLEQSALARATKAFVIPGLPTLIGSFGSVAGAIGGGVKALNVQALGLGAVFLALVLGFIDLFFSRGEHTGPDPNPITRLHVMMNTIGIIVNCLLPSMTYYCTFRISDNKRLPIIVVSIVSVLGILLQSIARAAVQMHPRPYLKTICIYVSSGIVLPAAAYGISQWAVLLNAQVQHD